MIIFEIEVDSVPFFLVPAERDPPIGIHFCCVSAFLVTLERVEPEVSNGRNVIEFRCDVERRQDQGNTRDKIGSNEARIRFCLISLQGLRPKTPDHRPDLDGIRFGCTALPHTCKYIVREPHLGALAGPRFLV